MNKIRCINQGKKVFSKLAQLKPVVHKFQASLVSVYKTFLIHVHALSVSVGQTTRESNAMVSQASWV